MQKLPDGTQLLTLWKGILQNPSDLPIHDNQLGDSWGTRSPQTHTWIWAIAKGQTQPYWIDP
jgi:hypothetical protein